MIEVLTGVFSGVVSGLIAGAFGYVKSRGKQFDFWILIVGAFVGLIAVQLGASYFAWQEWLLTVSLLAFFEYGGKVFWRKSNVQVTQRKGFSVWALNVGTAVYIVLFIAVLFLCFLPMIGTEFAFYELNKEGELAWRWFAEGVAQIERDAVAAYIIFGFPLMAIFSYYALLPWEDRAMSEELARIEDT